MTLKSFPICLTVSMSFDQGFGLVGETDMARAEAVAATQVLTATGGWTDMENSYPEDITLTPRMIDRARRHPDGDSGPETLVYVVDAVMQKRIEIEAETLEQAIDLAYEREIDAARNNPNGSRGWFFTDAPELDPIHIYGDTARGIEAVDGSSMDDPQADVVMVRMTKGQAAAIRSSVCRAAPLSDKNPLNSRNLTAVLDRAFPA